MCVYLARSRRNAEAHDQYTTTVSKETYYSVKRDLLQCHDQYILIKVEGVGRI